VLGCDISKFGKILTVGGSVRWFPSIWSPVGLVCTCGALFGNICHAVTWGICFLTNLPKLGRFGIIGLKTWAFGGNRNINP
jgi:hypothetical protein